MKKYKGTALITGGAQRIGQAMCFKLAELGYRIALHYHQSVKEAKKTAAQIQNKGGACELFFGNLLNERDVYHLIKKVKKACPDLNVLINNASIFAKTDFLNVSLDDFNRDFDVHLKAPFILTQQFARVCGKGNIINILDTNITKNKTDYFTYLLAKKGLLNLTEMTAIALAPNIRVNAIAPGFILAPKGAKKNYLDERKANVPLKTKGSIEQITQTVEFLLTNSYLTGQVIYNDGGEHLL